MDEMNAAYGYRECGDAHVWDFYAGLAQVEAEDGLREESEAEAAWDAMYANNARSRIGAYAL